jgi:hypothetical protein
MPTSSKQLEQVRALIKAGKKKQAVSELVRLIDRDHDNPELWWLLANASEDLHQARKALEEMQMLAPQDTRAEKMLKRLDTRIKLDQMGLQPTRQNNRNNSRVMVLSALSVILIIILGVGFAALTGGFAPSEEIILPTVVVFENTATPVPPTPTPTDTMLPAAVSTQPIIVAELTREVSVAEMTRELIIAEVTVDVQPPPATITFESNPTNAMMMPTRSFPNMPTSNPLSNPTPFIPPTALSQPYVRPMGQSLTQSELTSEVMPGIYYADPFAYNITPSPTMIPTIVPLNRGQIVERIPRRDLIEPYGVHAFTFSGYRDEKIKLELQNLSRDGNPSLELKDPLGTVIASDIDTQSAQNLDAVIELSLPGDGIYTIIVRMAAVNEQLYYLVLTRG